jgi:predicted extracellular nuclease
MAQPLGSGASRLRAILAAALIFSALAALLPAPPAHASPNGVVISEFRFRGPAGGNDEFVELFNTSASAVDISGYRLQGCASSSGAASDRVSVPAGTSLPSGGHYLFTNSGSGGYSGAVAGDRTYTTGFSDATSTSQSGARIVDGSGTVIDGVGSPLSPCREGSGLTTPTATDDQSFERKAGGTQDTDDNAADFEGPKAGGPQNSGSAPNPPGPTITRIHSIQGSGLTSPLSGQTVTIEGVVTGIDDEIGASFSGTFPEDAGIFVQEEAADQDANPDTSEGIFVGYVRDRQAYPAGSVVRLNGRVREKFGYTIVSETINQEPVIVGTAPVPDSVTLDEARAQAQDPDTRPYYETLESMRVRLATGIANSGGTNKFGELFLTPGTERDRVFRTETAPALLATDADAGAGDPDNPYRDPDGSTTEVQADLFDRVDNVVGPLTFSFGNFKIMVQPGLLPTVTKGPTPYPYDRIQPQGRYQVRISSFNVENYLPAGAELDLGTVTPEEEALKRDRIVDAIGRLLKRPDVVAVQEVGNKALLDAVAVQLGGYTAYLEEGNDSRGIDVGFLVKNTVTATNVRQLGKDAAGPQGFDCSDVEGGLFDRPPLFADITTAEGRKFTVVSNHFASKAAPDACREAQAAFVRDRVAEIERAGGQAIVTGDLNAFEDEGALRVLQDGTTTLTNQWAKAPEQERYSFQFNGRLQTLDHILITDGLEPLFRDFLYAHIDNDYYERETQPDGHKVSDHDPPTLTLADESRWDYVLTDEVSTFYIDSKGKRVRFVSGSFDTGILDDRSMVVFPHAVRGDLRTERYRITYSYLKYQRSGEVRVYDLRTGKQYYLRGLAVRQPDTR